MTLGISFYQVLSKSKHFVVALIMPPKKDGKKKKGKGPEFTVEDIEAFVKVRARGDKVFSMCLVLMWWKAGVKLPFDTDGPMLIFLSLPTEVSLTLPLPMQFRMFS